MSEFEATPAPAEPEVIAEAESPTPPEPQETSMERAFREAGITSDETPKEVAAEKDAEQPATPDGDRPRGPDGKFVAKEPAQTPEKAVDGDSKAETPETPKEPVSAAPTRFSSDAKAEWEKAPKSVRGEVSRAISELEAGIAQKNEQLEPLKPFFDMAQQHGVQLHETLDRYVKMENALRSNPRAGMEALAGNFGMTLPDFIAQVTGKQPEGDQTQNRQVLALQQQVQHLQEQLGTVTTAMQSKDESAVLQEVNAFAAENPRFEELMPEIQRLIETGYASDLKEAYDVAERLNPAPQPNPAPVPQPAPAQTRVQKSVTGAPSAGSNPVNRTPSKTVNESISRAFAQTGLS